jgi:hypothetical protein
MQFLFLNYLNFKIKTVGKEIKNHIIKCDTNKVSCWTKTRFSVNI